MEPVQSPATGDAKIEEIVRNSCNAERAFVVIQKDSVENRKKWQDILVELTEWKSYASRFAEDDLEPPTVHGIRQATRLATAFRDKNLCIPARVAPNGDGGISFEKKSGMILEIIEIDEEGQMEWYTFENAKLVYREPLFFEH